MAKIFVTPNTQVYVRTDYGTRDYEMTGQQIFDWLVETPKKSNSATQGNAQTWDPWRDARCSLSINGVCQELADWKNDPRLCFAGTFQHANLGRVDFPSIA